MSYKIKQNNFELGRMDIVDLYGWEKGNKLITGPYFQRYSVWRLKDRIAFIDTIFNGYPIPSIFLCEGDMDLTTLQNTYYVLDGRQRLESIFMFINGDYKFNDKYFNEFDSNQKKHFLNYSIPIIQIYIPKETEADQESFKEDIRQIFTRLNKNSYDLNKIEKQTSQYNEYDFIKICKIVCGFLSINPEELEEYENELLNNEDEDEDEIKLTTSEGIEYPTYVIEACKEISYISKLFSEKIRKNKNLFTQFQTTRQINLQHLINIIGSIHEGFIDRNLKMEKTEEYSTEVFINNHLKKILTGLNNSSKLLIAIFEDESLDKWWVNKSNLYTFLIVFYRKEYYDIALKDKIIEKLNSYKNESDFSNYQALCANSVNDVSIRKRRNEIIETLIGE